MFVFYFSVIGGGGWAKKKNFRGGGEGQVILSRVGHFFFEGKMERGGWEEKEILGEGVVIGLIFE